MEGLFETTGTSLKRDVFRSNQTLAQRGLVVYAFGNASGIDREADLVVIKPSGVAYESLKAEDMTRARAAPQAQARRERNLWTE